jgi:hypothetical protein
MAKIGQPIKNYEGRRFGTLTVLGEYQRDYPKSNLTRWLTRCDCGREQWVYSRALRKGQLTHRGHCSVRSIVTHAESNRRYTAKQRSKGMCQRCAEPAEPNRTRCKKHLEYARNHESKRKQLEAL